tara:strand:+ start:1291 stop:3000 length:1710 start_codon:yes stop_codon:yes gene_type:complete
MEKKLRELISKFLQEYSGHHTMKNASPRPFADDKDEIESYTYKSIYGGDGGHYKNEPAFHNPNRTKMGMFELKKFIEDTIKEQAYNHATLTTQGLPNSSRAIVPTDEYPFSARPKSRLPGIMEEDEPIDPDYQGPSYDEVYLSKLVDSGMSSIFYKENNLFYIYPTMGNASNIPNPRLTTTYQSIVFKLEKGELHFVQAMIYERVYDGLKSVFPELPQGHGGTSGFTNINGGSEITYPILLPNGGNDIEKAKQMVQIVKKGLDVEIGLRNNFYTRQPGTGGTGIDERMNEMEDAQIDRLESGANKTLANVAVYRAENAVDDTKMTNAAGTAASTQAIDAAQKQLVDLNNQLLDVKTKYGQTKQQYQQEKERYEEIPTDEENLEEKTAMYKKLQNLKETIKTLFTQMGTLSTSVKAAKNAESEAVSASYKGKTPVSPLEKAVRDARKAARNVGKTQTAESLLRQYEKERANINLMEQMDSYNETTRGSLKQFFEMFEAGRTTSEVIRHYAKKGIQIPEQFCSKVKKQFESYKKLKLELGFSEQEAKDFKKALDLSQKEDKKELSTRIFKK